MSDPGADPIFDCGMTARANGLPRSTNSEKPGTSARAAWDKGWLTGEVRTIEIAEAAETPPEAAEP